MREKHCDIIVANDVSKKETGFNVDFNEVMDGPHIDTDKLKTILDNNQIDLFDSNVFLWVGSDNLRKGAALNAVQIAELIISKYSHFLKK